MFAGFMRWWHLVGHLLLVHACLAFTPPGTQTLVGRWSYSATAITRSGSVDNDFDSSDHLPTASLVGNVDPDEKMELLSALRDVGYQTISNEAEVATHRYTYSKATGMLKLMSEPSTNTPQPPSFEAPRWVPVVCGEENILVANGWSFLDSDESEPNSAFDVDAANLEGLYQPKWGQEDFNEDEISVASLGPLPVSHLGFSLRPMSAEQVNIQAKDLESDLSKKVLLEGGTDPPKRKITHNGFDFSGSASQSDIHQGLCVCAIGGLPLFSSMDLSPTTATSAWLSFSRPISEDHVLLVHPLEGSVDQRIEVLCAKSRCHLGHYFGPGEGYCINASALKFVPRSQSHGETWGLVPLVSWRSLDAARSSSRSNEMLYDVMRQDAATETLVLGAGCFWHVEFALRRLPGVVCTTVGYAGGATTKPTYKDVCERETGHAEVVRVMFDTNTLSPRHLIDCFFTLHDPTKVRAHGKHSATGQYRSCIFVPNAEMEHEAYDALLECKTQLRKELSTEIRVFTSPTASCDGWFWVAEDRHQRHDEKRASCGKSNTSTLSVSEWLSEYGRRSQSVTGSA